MAIRAMAAVLVLSMIPAAALAQHDSFPIVDWGPMIQTEAMNSAIDYAARQGSGKPQAKQAPARAGNAKTRANCARARGWAADGVQDARLPRILSMCKQLGY